MMPPLLFVNKGLALNRESFIYCPKWQIVHHFFQLGLWNAPKLVGFHARPEDCLAAA